MANAYEDRSVPYVILVEVKDQNDVTVYLQFAIGTLVAESRTDAGLSWSPDKAGNYELRSFAISNFTSPQILTPTWQSEVTIMP